MNEGESIRLASDPTGDGWICPKNPGQLLADRCCDQAFRRGVAETLLAKLKPLEPRPERRYQLSGDGRLDFWREAYLVALGARLPTALGPIYDQGQLTRVADAAALSADLAVAGHLLRCEPGKLDELIEAMRLILGAQVGGKPTPGE
jgi:hypothetical protein